MMNIVNQNGMPQIDGIEIWKILNQNGIKIEDDYFQWMMHYIERSKLMPGVDYMQIGTKLWISIFSISSIISELLIDYGNNDIIPNFVNLKCFLHESYVNAITTINDKQKIQMERHKKQILEFIIYQNVVSKTDISLRYQRFGAVKRDIILDELLRDNLITKIIEKNKETKRQKTMYSAVA